MSTGTTLINIKDFQNKNNHNIKNGTDSIYKLTVEALANNNISSLEKSYKELSNNFEAISNALELTNEVNETIYNFGRTVALTELILDLIKYDNLSCVLEQISKNYPLLLPVLEAIKKHNTVSGVKLQKELNLKSSSNLSNFTKRVEKYDLFYVKKIGTTNYYSLTRKGRQLISKNQHSTEDANTDLIPLKNVYTLLDGISEEIGKIHPNRIKVVHSITSQCNIKEKRLLKHKIDTVFNASEKFKLTKIKKIIDTPSHYEYNSNVRSNTAFLSYDMDNKLS